MCPSYLVTSSAIPHAPVLIHHAPQTRRNPTNQCTEEEMQGACMQTSAVANQANYKQLEVNYRRTQIETVLEKEST